LTILLTRVRLNESEVNLATHADCNLVFSTRPICHSEIHIWGVCYDCYQ